MRYKVPVLSALLAAAVTYITSLILGPQPLNEAIIHSPAGAVLVGRVFLVYELAYRATGNSFFSIFAGILFNNTMSIAVLFTVPPVLHLLYTNQWRSRWLRPRLLPPLTWRGCQVAMLSLAAIFLSLFSVAFVAVTSLSGPALFMVTETAYIVMAASVLVKASTKPYETLLTDYSKTLGKTLPIIVALILVSAALEAYEILSRLQTLA